MPETSGGRERVTRDPRVDAARKLMMSEFDGKLGGVIGSPDQFRTALAEFGKPG